MSEKEGREVIKINIELPVSYKEEDLVEAARAVIPIEPREVKRSYLLKRTLDLTDKTDIKYKATLALSLSEEREAGLLKMRKKVSAHFEEELVLPKARFDRRPVVVGAGPAGLFAALTLAEAGARPILLERGLPVDQRAKKVALFSSLGILDPECNIQYGEGGAGTYSDGKLKVGSKDKYKEKILREFAFAGAPSDILFSSNAHVGTDKLSGVVKTIREKMISLGAEVIFSAKMTDIVINSSQISAIWYEKDGKREKLETDTLILCTGHSARDSFEALRSAGARLTPRPFGIGLRIEHPREYINSLVYGGDASPELETASYHLVTHLEGGRSVYSFCMCPGGSIVPAASEEGGIVTNGMSEYARRGENSNAALLVSAYPSDFPSDDPLAGIDLQRSIERRAYALSGTYRAPAESLESFLSSSKPRLLDTRPSYPLGVFSASVEDHLPEFVSSALRAAISDFDSWLPGYKYPSAVLTGPETRSTSPLRVERGEDLQAIGIKGLYPAGEGAGYSGGIVSSARDGIMAAEAAVLTKAI